jgi:hypothetical protein
MSYCEETSSSKLASLLMVGGAARRRWIVNFLDLIDGCGVERDALPVEPALCNC